jgi:hypothetical protein
MTTVTTASIGGIAASYQLRANNPVPKPASPLANPPASAPAAIIKKTSTLITACAKQTVQRKLTSLTI